MKSMWGSKLSRENIWRSSTGKLKKMRHKVNFHVMLWFLSSCTINVMGNQAPNSLSQTNYSVRNNSDDGVEHNESNTFLINENHQNVINWQNGNLTNTTEQPNAPFDSINFTQRLDHTETGEAGAIVKIENKQQQQQLESIASKMEENASPWPPPAKQLNNKYFVNQAQTRTIQNNGSSEMPTNTTDTKVNKYFARKNTVSLTDEINQITESMPSTKLHIWTTTDTPITNTKYPHHNAIVNGSTSRTGSTHFQIAQKQLILSKNVHTEPPPMLNHILDSLSVSNSKHLHHDSRYGPHFEDIPTVGNVTNITVPIGNAVYLNCRISLLQDKTVSWVRRKPGETGLELLTVGLQTYSADARYKIEFQYPNNWKLKIEAVIKEDEGTYECQISTYPPRVIQKNIFVIDPKVIIIDEEGSALQDKYYEVDSTLQLSCIVRNVKMASTVFWSHGDRILNYDVDRGGINVKTEILDKGANSSLLIAKINKSDSGNYSCSINATHEYTVSVHVLNGESYAELHHGKSSAKQQSSVAAEYKFMLILLNVLWFLLQLQSR